MMQDLTELYQKIAAIGRRLGASRVLLYGSRARGDHRERSDIDIAVFGAEPSTMGRFRLLGNWDLIQKSSKEENVWLLINPQPFANLKKTPIPSTLTKILE